MAQLWTPLPLPFPLLAPLPPFFPFPFGLQQTRSAAGGRNEEEMPASRTLETPSNAALSPVIARLGNSSDQYLEEIVNYLQRTMRLKAYNRSPHPPRTPSGNPGEHAFNKGGQTTKGVGDGEREDDIEIGTSEKRTSGIRTRRAGNLHDARSRLYRSLF